MECLAEAPENATIDIMCNSEMIFHDVHFVEYGNTYNMTGNVSYNISQQLSIYCNLTVIFSNAVGSSNPLILHQSTCNNYYY